VPCTYMRVNSLMAPPGIPDFFTRRRVLATGSVQLHGRAWSGNGTQVVRVEVAVDGKWGDARLAPAAGPWAWRAWSYEWDALPGEHTLACRATDANGEVQPEEPVPDAAGFGNNSTHKVQVTVGGHSA
jgi:hypothetical protein